MRLLLTFLITLLPAPLLATGVGELWHCDLAHSGGYEWVGGEWKLTTWEEGVYEVFLADGHHASWYGEQRIPLTCQSGRVRDKTDVVRCFNHLGGVLILDRDTGRGGVSGIYSVVLDERRSPISVSVLQCTLSEVRSTTPEEPRNPGPGTSGYDL